MKTVTVKNFLFDLGNVIIDLDMSRATSALNDLMKPGADRKVIDRIMLEYECGRVSDDLFINGILSQSHRHIQALDVIVAWNSMLKGIPLHRLQMLLKLKELYHIYLLSNTNAIHLEFIHRYLSSTYGIVDFEKTYFHKAYYSHQMGVRKPSREIFHMVIDQTPLDPAETLYMDDLKDNIDMAASMGFQTYLVKEEEEICDFLVRSA